MPIYSLPNEYNPTLFDSKLCNCYRFFNDAFRNLEVYLETYIKTKKFDGDIMHSLIDEIFRDFYMAYTILGDDDRNLVEYRYIFMQYTFIAALFQNPENAAWFYQQNLTNRRAFNQGEADIYTTLAAAAATRGDVRIIHEEDVYGIGNLAMFAALCRGIATCESGDYLKLSADDFLLRFILAVAPDDSVLHKHLGSLSWLNLPEKPVERRSNLFLPPLTEARGELDVGKRYVLKILLGSYKNYALDESTAEIFRLGYVNYNQMYEDAQKILDAKAREFELYYLYGGSGGDLPASFHFRHLQKAFAADASAADFVAASFNKNSFSKYEIDLCSELADDSGFLAVLLDSMYYLKPVKEFSGARKIKFIFKNYPRVIYADFAQFSDNAVNYFWLPEMPQKILNTDDTEFYSPSQIKQLSSRAENLKITEGHGLSALEEPFLGMFMYSYAERLCKMKITGGFLEGNAAFLEFVLYLRNLPQELGKRAARHILKHAGVMENTEYAAHALNQLMFIAPDLETLKLLVAMPNSPGRLALALLCILDLPPHELLAGLGDAGFDALVSALIDRDSGGIFYHLPVAENLDNLLVQGRVLSQDAALYLNTAYLSHNFKSNAPARRGVLDDFTMSTGRTMPQDTEIRFLSMYLNKKLENREFDEVYFGAFEKLWKQSDVRGPYRDEACAILWRMLSGGDSPEFAGFLKYVEAFNEIGSGQSSVLHEFQLYCKIMNGHSISQNEAELMYKLYKAQMVVTARTKAVAEAIGVGTLLARDLIAFEWVNASATWKDVEVKDANYGDFLSRERDEAREADEGNYTYVFDVGYVNVYTLCYIADGKHYSRVIGRGLAENQWEREIIFESARDYLDGKTDSSADFLLLAGRVCVDSSIFDAEVLFDYIHYMEDKPNLRAEMSRALLYVLSNQNALAKACLYTRNSYAMAERLKRFYSTCLAFWPDVKKKTDVRALFTYIRSLERIVGVSKLDGLQEYLSDQILRNPHIRPDLTEEYRYHYMQN